MCVDHLIHPPTFLRYVGGGGVTPPKEGEGGDPPPKGEDPPPKGEDPPSIGEDRLLLSFLSWISLPFLFDPEVTKVPFLDER